MCTLVTCNILNLISTGTLNFLSYYIITYRWKNLQKVHIVADIGLILTMYIFINHLIILDAIIVI